MGSWATASLGAAELHGQGDEPGLRAVVEVALDAAQLRGLRVDGLATRSAEGVDALLQLAGPERRELVAEVDEGMQAQQHAQPDDGPEDPRSLGPVKAHTNTRARTA